MSLNHNTSATNGINFHCVFIIQHISDSKLPALINAIYFPSYLLHRIIFNF